MPSIPPLSVLGSDKKISLSKSLPSTTAGSEPTRNVSASHSRAQSRAASVVGSYNRRLTESEVEQTVRNTVKVHRQDLLQAFQTYDVDHNATVTKAEFRRVLELFCIPFTNAQFQSILNKVDMHRHNSIRYIEFLDKFSVTEDPGSGEKPQKATRLLSPVAPTDLLNVEKLEQALREKITRNLQPFLKALRLFDYNRDRKIQRHELKKCIENYCFHVKEPQFDRLWQRHDYHHTGVIDYLEFLQRIGVPVASPKRPPDAQGAVANLSNAGPRTSKMSFEEIEQDFRRKMQENYRPLWKTFMAHDPNQEGFVAIETLKSILSQFIMPLSDAMFKQLVDRTGIKASGKVQWLTFLQKFRDPQAASNGQTIPIKSNHKANCIRGVDMRTDLGHLLELLHSHVTNAYSSFRSAFLQMDRNRDGKITRRELRRLLDRFKLTISAEQFKELMILLDPQHTGFITYHHFLDLFEPKESSDAHVWLKSNHRYNDRPAPNILAWSAVEGILTEKISLNWREFVNCMSHYDPAGTGFIQPDQLKKVIDKVVMPISPEHLENIVSRLKMRDDAGRICALELLSLLGVDVRPLDTEGLSTNIMRSNEQDLMLRQADHDHRMNGIEDNAERRTTEMSVHEIVVRLRDRMAQHKAQIRHAFVAMDRSRKGRISRVDFRQILASYGLQMKDEQFSELMTYLGFGDDQKSLNYLDFLTYFDDPRNGPRTQTHVLSKSNHRVNAVRGDEFGMSAERVEERLRAKLRENFADLRGAFHKFDDTRQGFISRPDFRRLLDSFMCITNDEEFERLCARLGLEEGAKLSYPQFLERFQLQDSLAQGHKWLDSQHRFNQAKPPALQSAEEVHKALAPLVHQHYDSVTNAFRHIDQNGRGCIRRKELKQLLGRFNLPMDADAFKSLWKMYDPSGRGAITMDAFLHRLGISQQFLSSDQHGPSCRIIQESHDATMMQLANQQFRQEQITEKQANLGAILEDDQVFDVVRTRILNDFKDTAAAFRHFDRGLKGHLTAVDFEAVLNQASLFVSDEQFTNFMHRIGLTVDEDHMPYEHFCSAFELKPSGPERNLDSGISSTNSSLARPSEGLAPEIVEQQLREAIREDFEMVQKAMKSFDKEENGRISVSDFRRVLENFCMKMSDAQFKELLKKAPVSHDSQVDYATFLAAFTITELPLAEGASSEPPRNGQLSQEEVEMQLRGAVAARLFAFREAFEHLDYARIGVVAREDFREIVQRLAVRLTDEQFEALWRQLPINEFGNLDYGVFLAAFSGATAAPPPPPPPPPLQEEPLAAQTPSGGPQPSSAIFARKNGEAAELSAEGLLQNVVMKHWKSIFTKCKTLESNGELSIYAFIGVMRQHSCQLHPGDLVPLIRRFGLHGDGLFRYQDFLRSLVLSAQPADAKIVREKLQKAKIPIKSRDQSRDLFDCMCRLRQRLLAEWKKMRRAFRDADPNNAGKVRAGEFRQVLFDFGLKLSEDEFYHLMTHYDSDLTGRIDYNAFIKSFLLTA